MKGGGSIPVEVGPTGVAVGDPVKMLIVPLLIGPTGVGWVPLLGLALVPPVGTGTVTEDSVVSGQYVVVYVCVTVVLSSAEVVTTVDVTVELRGDEVKVTRGGSPEAEVKVGIGGSLEADV